MALSVILLSDIVDGFGTAILLFGNSQQLTLVSDLAKLFLSAYHTLAEVQIPWARD